MRFIEAIPELQELVLGMGRDGELTADDGNYTLEDRGVLVSHILTRWPVDFPNKTHEENVDWLLNDIRTHTGTQRPAFMNVMALSWTFNPSGTAEVYEKLGDDYVPVTTKQLHELYRQAHPVKGK